jgi:hypothetical protein
VLYKVVGQVIVKNARDRWRHNPPDDALSANAALGDLEDEDDLECDGCVSDDKAEQRYNVPEI